MDRKAAILEAAIDLFAERGYFETSTLLIAKRAKVAEGTIFHHFGTKEGLLTQILAVMLSDFFKAAEKLSQRDTDGLTDLLDLVDLFFAFAEIRPKETLILLRDMPCTLAKPEYTNENFHDGVSRFLFWYEASLEKGLKDGSIRDLPKRQTALSILGLINGVLRFIFLHPTAVGERSSLTAEASAFITRSVAAKPEIR